MSYNYKTQRSNLFTEKGQLLFLAIRDNVNQLLEKAGAVREQEGSMHGKSGVSGESWDELACFDRMVELGELREITGPGTPGQYRVFVKNTYR